MRRVFIGLENINPDNLIAAKKRQNKITEYREMLQKWRNHGAITYAGYILGFPVDTKASILRRTCACPIGRSGTTLSTVLWFYLTILYEGAHPLESGAFRLKYRCDRRHGPVSRSVEAKS